MSRWQSETKQIYADRESRDVLVVQFQSTRVKLLRSQALVENNVPLVANLCSVVVKVPCGVAH